MTLCNKAEKEKKKFRPNTRCDDENVRDGGNTDLPEQHFLLIEKKIFIGIVGAHFLSLSDAAELQSQ